MKEIAKIHVIKILNYLENLDQITSKSTSFKCCYI